MQRRQFVLGGASAIALPLVGCGEGPSGPVPVPASMSVIRMPADHYLHRTAPTEWWWHIGTLRAADRVFGFELNAVSWSDFGFSQLMLTDTKTGRHYQRTTPYLKPFMFDADNWAQHDPTKDWSVALGSPTNTFSAIQVTNPGSGYTSDPTVVVSGGGGALGSAAAVRDPATGTIKDVVVVGGGIGYTSIPNITIVGGGGSGATARAFHSYITMNAAWGDPTKNMAIKARLVDDPTFSVVDFDLAMTQQGPVFIVKGTGVNPIPGTTGNHLQTNNYYYSLTNIQARGSVTVDGQRFEVTGTTWMDHEYGAFEFGGQPIKWILQDFQLDNGVSISNYSILGTVLPGLNESRASHATIMLPDGRTYYEPTTTTPVGRTWTSPRTGRTYFLDIKVEIPAFGAVLNLTTPVESQEFPVEGAPVYEGVATATGTFDGRSVTATAWNEQALR